MSLLQAANTPMLHTHTPKPTYTHTYVRLDVNNRDCPGLFTFDTRVLSATLFMN